MSSELISYLSYTGIGLACTGLSVFSYFGMKRAGQDDQANVFFTLALTVFSIMAVVILCVSHLKYLPMLGE